MVCCGRSHAIILKGGSTFGCTYWSKSKDYLILWSHILKFNLNTPLSIVIFLPQGKFSKGIIYARRRILKFWLATCSPGSFVGCWVGGRQTQLSSRQSGTPLQTLGSSGIQQLGHTLSSGGLGELSALSSCPPPNPRGYHILAVMRRHLWCLMHLLLSVSTREKVLECAHMGRRGVERGFFFFLKEKIE